ncbi:TPA: hypothetical protein I7272_23985 [Vibrio parahaemolyticus]|nr:hypothetical protein [Vibrio parahaemolyticus]HAS6696104.1 hypothetical protein [Vibrio parahaemolyticus]
MIKRKFEIHGFDANGDKWIVASDVKETAEAIAKKFRAQGYTDVRIIKN